HQLLQVHPVEHASPTNFWQLSIRQSGQRSEFTRGPQTAEPSGGQERGAEPGHRSMICATCETISTEASISAFRNETLSMLQPMERPSPLAYSKSSSKPRKESSTDFSKMS